MGTKLRTWLQRQGEGADHRLAVAVECHVTTICRIADFKIDAGPKLARRIVRATKKEVDFNSLYTRPGRNSHD